MKARFGFCVFALAMTLGISSAASAELWDNDINGRELRNFDGFLDSHSWVQRDLNSDPGLVRNPHYLAAHPEFREFLERHPGVREEIRENPRRFVRAERRWDRREDRREEWRNRERDRWSNGWHR